MKIKQYEGQHHTTELWLAKLMEEVGEVANEIVEAVKSSRQAVVNDALACAVEELEHVEFIARCFREDLQSQLA